MSLWEFIQKRCELKNIKPFDLVDEGISSASLYRMQDGGTPGERIKNKLSAALGCSIGEINEAISQTDQTTPFGETVKKTKKKESIMETVDKLEKMVSEKPADEEPAEVFQADEPEVEPVDMMFPVETEAETDNRITREVAEECYKRKLKDKVGKILASTHHELTDKVRQEIGVMLLQELWGDNE